MNQNKRNLLNKMIEEIIESGDEVTIKLLVNINGIQCLIHSFEDTKMYPQGNEFSEKHFTEHILEKANPIAYTNVRLGLYIYAEGLVTVFTLPYRIAGLKILVRQVEEAYDIWKHSRGKELPDLRKDERYA